MQSGYIEETVIFEGALPPVGPMTSEPAREQFGQEPHLPPAAEGVATEWDEESEDELENPMG